MMWMLPAIFSSLLTERSYISFWTNVYLLCQSLPIPSQYILHLDIKMYSCTILSFLKRKIRRSYWHYMTEKDLKPLANFQIMKSCSRSKKASSSATGAILYTCRLWSIFQQLSLSQNQVQRFPFPEVFQRAFRMPISHLCLRSRLYITKKE